MSSGTRLLIAVGCGIVLIVTSTVAVAAFTIYGPGAMSVDVVPKSGDGTRFSIRIPSFVVQGAAALIPIEALEVDRAEVEVRTVLPIAAKALECIANAPDAILVEVEDHGEKVSIAKEGGRIVIHVESNDETVDVSIPLGTVRAVSKRFARAVENLG